jgi:hypothetical protein
MIINATFNLRFSILNLKFPVYGLATRRSVNKSSWAFSNPGAISSERNTSRRASREFPDASSARARS